MADQIIWGIHAGKTGDADKLFMSQNVVAVGWQEMGDLNVPQTRDDYKKRYLQVFPGTSPAGVANSAGQLFRFVREMKVGQLVAYPSRATRTIHVGRITGDYRYRPDLEVSYPNQRTVEWLKEVPRTALSRRRSVCRDTAPRRGGINDPVRGFDRIITGDLGELLTQARPLTTHPTVVPARG